MPRKSTYMEKFTGVMLESKYGDNYIIHNSEAFPTYNVTFYLIVADFPDLSYFFLIFPSLS